MERLRTCKRCRVVFSTDMPGSRICLKCKRKKPPYEPVKRSKKMQEFLDSVAELRDMERRNEKLIRD